MHINSKHGGSGVVWFSVEGQQAPPPPSPLFMHITFFEVDHFWNKHKQTQIQSTTNGINQQETRHHIRQQSCNHQPVCRAV
jgi:hypothetical protein